MLLPFSLHVATVTTPNLGCSRRKSSKPAFEFAKREEDEQLKLKHSPSRPEEQDGDSLQACSLPACVAKLARAGGSECVGAQEVAFLSQDGLASDALPHSRPCPSPFQIASLEYGLRSSQVGNLEAGRAEDGSCSDRGCSGDGGGGGGSSSRGGGGGGCGSGSGSSRGSSTGSSSGCRSKGAGAGLVTVEGSGYASGGSAACAPESTSTMPHGCAAVEGAQEPVGDHQGTGTGTAGGGSGALAQTEDVPGSANQLGQPGLQQPIQEPSQPHGAGLQQQQQQQQQQQPLQPTCAALSGLPAQSTQEQGGGPALSLPSSASSMRQLQNCIFQGIKEQGPLGSQPSDALSTDMCR